jgi:hypothetical protein
MAGRIMHNASESYVTNIDCYSYLVHFSSVYEPIMVVYVYFYRDKNILRDKCLIHVWLMENLSLGRDID